MPEGRAITSMARRRDSRAATSARRGPDLGGNHRRWASDQELGGAEVERTLRGATRRQGLGDEWGADHLPASCRRYAAPRVIATGGRPGFRTPPRGGHPNSMPKASSRQFRNRVAAWE